MGWPYRYTCSRLAIARSLSIDSQPELLAQAESENMANAIRGIQLFGDDDNAVAWVALIVQHCKVTRISKRVLQQLVSRHWNRGAQLLLRDWKECAQDVDRFTSHIVELAGFEESSSSSTGINLVDNIFRGKVNLKVGEIGRDVKTREDVTFFLNGPGSSPHVAIMGGVGSGKTRTAIEMVRQIRDTIELPILAFDFKGDLSENLAEMCQATIVRPSEGPVPLDVLHMNSRDEMSIKRVAPRLRDSIASIKQTRMSGIQSEALRDAIFESFVSNDGETPVTLSDVASMLVDIYDERGRNPDELTSLLTELTQIDLFAPIHTPATFFSRNWIIQIPQDSSTEMRRLIMNLTLQALDRWVNSLPDSSVDEEGYRAMRHLTLLDEAHVVLASKLPALGNLIRMSRSKGGCVLLVSQSPDDFEGVDDEYLANMGMTLAFNTQAKPGPTRRIFGSGSDLVRLTPGQAFCRIRGNANTQRVLVWNV